MKSKIVIMLLLLSLVSLTSCSSAVKDEYEKQKAAGEAEYERLVEEAEKNVSAMLSGSDDSAESDTAETAQTEKEPIVKETTETEKEEVEAPENDVDEPTEKEVPGGTYDISGTAFYFSRSVINDTTGNWRLSTTNTDMSIDKYALEYYNTMFSSDDEIHAVVNFGTSTTNRIAVTGNLLFVTELEYVDGEEHDAKILFSGKVINEYIIDIETGEVE